MPKQRVVHGAIYVEQQASGGDGNPPGIRHTDYVPGEKIPAGASLHELPSLDVSWGREASFVQLGLTVSKEWLEKLQADTITPNETHLALWTSVVDRHAINNMIRTLRRARDAAYGADE